MASFGSANRQQLQMISKQLTGLANSTRKRLHQRQAVHQLLGRHLHSDHATGVSNQLQMRSRLLHGLVSSTNRQQLQVRSRQQLRVRNSQLRSLVFKCHVPI